MFKIYCDGSCKGNGKENAVGAFAYVVLNGKDEELFHFMTAVPQTTNNQMEMMALINAIENLKQYCKENGKELEVEVYTDSAYIHNCMAQKWYKNWIKNGWINSKKEPVKNKNLWESIIPYFEDSRIKIFKVKGHADNKWNNYVDKLAQDAADTYKREKIL